MNDYGQAEDSIAAQPREFQPAIERDMSFEKTPNTFPTQISKGTLASNLGGVFELRDATGGTVLLTADPDTGVVTINGALQANVAVNIGTLMNPVINGTTTFSGTLNSSGKMVGGTIGTALIVGGTSSTQVINNATIGTPAMTGGTATSPHIGGTSNYTVNAATAALTNNGDFELQTKSGSVVLVARSGGTNFFFNCAGTF